MKKIVWIPALLFFALTANAQEHQQKSKQHTQRMQNSSPEERAEMRTKRMTEHLSLTEEQQKQVYNISLNQINTQKNFEKQNKEQAKERRTEFMKNREELENILNVDQKEKWNKAQKRSIAKLKKERSRKQGARFKRGHTQQRTKMNKKTDAVQSKIEANKNKQEDK